MIATKNIIRILYFIHLIIFRSLSDFVSCLLPHDSHKVYVQRWYGRLGNNLVQIAHAIFFAQQSHSEILIPEHPLLDIEKFFYAHSIPYEKAPFKGNKTGQVFINDILGKLKIESSEIRKSISRTFYFSYDLMPFRLRLTNYRDIFKNNLSSLLSDEIDASITDKTLVIHMRSGDIFKSQTYEDACIHEAMVQPPLNFYLEIIDKYDFEDIVIVTQADFRNPCIQELKKYFPHVRIQASTLKSDISTLLSAKHLIVGLSTFSIVIAFMSQNIQNLYIPLFHVKRGYWRAWFWPRLLKLVTVPISGSDVCQLDFNIFQVKIDNYIPVGGWTSSLQQLKIMINHTSKDVHFL